MFHFVYFAGLPGLRAPAEGASDVLQRKSSFVDVAKNAVANVMQAFDEPTANPRY